MESQAWKEFIKVSRPAYLPFIPSGKVLSGSLLDQTYRKYQEIGNEMIKSCKFYSLATDGWSNIRGEHLVYKKLKFIILF